MFYLQGCDPLYAVLHNIKKSSEGTWIGNGQKERGELNKFGCTVCKKFFEQDENVVTTETANK